ncbi:hypothetical protein ACFO3J_00725 [Streptomyces polygonati]|uniref:Pilus assembly protein n=1 Tax=Streptomyces polygonati TaxID=1617087 RepID=A0ABV8HD62_9ACTN
MGVIPLVVAVAVLAVVGVGRIVISVHEHTARGDLDRRARSYADALGDSYAQGRTGAAEFEALARRVGGGRIGGVSVATSAGGTVVNFMGDRRYSTPGNGWGGSVVVCYRVTLSGSMREPVPLRTVTC